MAQPHSNVKHVIAVASGKGGVGKSSVVLKLALALRDAGHAVGVLDADLTAPNIPLMLGVTRHAPATSIGVWRAPGRQKAMPALELQGLQVMSLQFMMSEQQALAIDGHIQRLLISKLWSGVSWGNLDYLLVDLPPGTGEVQQAVVTIMPVAGALIVVTPQYVAHLDARKLVTFLQQRDVRILGGVENMNQVACPHCDHTFELFTPVGQDRTIWADGVARLASLPFDASAVSSTSREPTQDTALDRELAGVTSALTTALPPSPPISEDRS